MKFIGIFMYVLSITVGIFCNDYTLEDLKNVFGSKICIQGSIQTIDFKSGNPLGDSFVMKESEKKSINDLPDTVSLERTPEEKSSLQKLNELAQHNEIDYYFKLEKEEGPAHDKTFTVSLILDKEKYVSEGKSLKKAQRNAASLALANTNYALVPLKDKSESNASLTPTVLLNNLSLKLGFLVKYFLVDEEKEGILKSNVVVDPKTKKSYIQRLNESVYSNRGLRTKKDLPQIKGPFTVKVQVGDKIFFGTSHTIQSARHNAASNALEYLIKNKDSLESDCLNEEEAQKCKQARATLKSPISLVYEAAQIRKLNIEFEIIEESGPAHRKTFITQCRLGDVTTTGEGKSKKESKRIAAENMLEKLSELPPISQEMQVKNMINKKTNKKKNKKKKIIRTKFEEVGMAVENFVGSVFGFNKKEELENQDNDIDGNIGKPKKPVKPWLLKHSYQDELLELSNFLNIQVQYSNFQENDKYYSLLSLYIDPEHLCFGEGLHEREAKDKAANGALDLLVSLGLYDHFDEKYSLERDTKEAVNTIITNEISEDTNQQ